MNELTRLEDQLLDVEARVALLEACRPIGIAREEARLEELLRSAAPEATDLLPRLDWPRRPALDLERFRLEQVVLACEKLVRGADADARLASILARRAQELELDIQIVQARGTRDIVRLAGQRFVGAHPAARVAADRLACDWLERGPGPDAGEPLLALAEELRRLISNSALQLDVLEVDMAARAAITDKALLVRRGALVTSPEAARIFTHEVFGHWLPRKAALISGPPFRIGPAGADADEEGRALHLEMQSGRMDEARQFELGVRHVLAAYVLDGEPPGEAILRVRAAGVPASLLARAAPRVLRAGGLCREIIYLPGLLRVGPSLIDAEIERVFRAGRATLAEIATLSALLSPAQASQSRSATTGV